MFGRTHTVIITCLFYLKSNFKKYLDQVGLKNRSPQLNALFKTVTGILFLDLNCPLQFSMANNFLDTIIHDLPLIVNEIEQESFLKFLNYLNTIQQICYTNCIKQSQKIIFTTNKRHLIEIRKKSLK
jgi:hypothetical protein